MLRSPGAALARLILIATVLALSGTHSAIRDAEAIAGLSTLTVSQPMAGQRRHSS